MAAPARLVRLGISTYPRLLSECSHASRLLNRTTARAKSTSSMGRGSVKRDEEFVTPYQSFKELRESQVDDAFEASIANLSESEKIKLDEEGERWLAYLDSNKQLKQMSEEVEETFKNEEKRLTYKVRRDFWNEDELEEEEITDGKGEDQFAENEITSMAHDELEEHKERRMYARYAVWEMPLLSQWAKPFEPPTQEQVLRFRYTTYMGEWHKGSNKVVVEFSPRDLGLSDAEQLKLKKLVGARYNPEEDVVKMSCEMFDNQAQNKRYLGDMVEKLVGEAKDHTEMFEDIALDVRHHRFRRKLRFPEEWKLTEERKKMLTDLRMQQLRTDSESLRIDGLSMIAAAHGRLPAPAPEARKQRMEVPIRAEIRMPEVKRRTGLRKGMR